MNLFKEYNRLLSIFLKLFSKHVMMQSSSLEKESIIRNLGNTLILEKEIDDTAIKDVRSLFKHEEEEKENHYKPVRVSNNNK